MLRNILVALALAAPVGAQLFQSNGTVGLGANSFYALADFNLDGRVDLVHAEGNNGQLKISFGTSSGGFSAAASAGVTIDAPATLVPGDFDNDGKMDLAILSSGALFTESRARVLIGSGTGTFTPASPLALTGIRAGAAGDFDRDGNLDLVLVLTSGSGTLLRFIKGNGAGGLTAPPLPPAQLLPVPAGATIDEIQAADLNNDGKLDVVMPMRQGNIGGLLAASGDGTGVFSVIANVTTQSTLLTRARVALADFNQDGRLDAALIGYQPNEVSLFINSGSTLVAQTPAPIPAGSPLYAIVAGDFDLSGGVDWIVSRPAVPTVENPQAVAQLYVGLGSGSGFFSFPPESPLATGGMSPAIETGDFNGDRKMDLLVLEGPQGEAFRILLNASPRLPTWEGQVINFAAIAERGQNESPLTPPLSASSGLPVSLASLTNAVCTVNKGVVTLLGIGECTLVAAQAGNLRYAAAVPVQRSFIVTGPVQRITFDPLPNTTLDTPSLTVSATSSSGLPVTFSASPATVCTVSDTTVTLVGVGQCSVTASQPGNNEYPAATPVTRTFNVGPGRPPGPQIDSAVNAASYARGSILSPGSYGAIFGLHFGVSPVLQLRDAAGATRNLDAIFNSNTQINFVLPVAIALGPAKLILTNPAGSAEFDITIDPISPGLFSSAGTGQGLAAAQVLIVNVDKSVTSRLVTDGPIPVLAGTEVYLVLYGTGIRGHGGSVFVTIGGQLAEVLYAGQQGFYPGLDQVNVRVPLTLAGRGLTDIQLLVDGRGANAVQADFQ